MQNNNLYVYSFYRFVKIRNKKIIKNKIDNFLKKKINAWNSFNCK